MWPANFQRWEAGNRHYHRRLIQVFQNLVPPGQRIIEIGCAQGDLLAALKPSYGVGVDFSAEMVARARQKHPELTFVHADAHELALEETFDVIILSDLINDVWDVEMVFQRIRALAKPSTRVIVNYYSRVWAPLLALTAKLGLSTPKLAQNWLVSEDVINLLYLAGFETLRNQPEILWPLPFRPISVLCNRWLAKLWPFRYFALTNLTIAGLSPSRWEGKLPRGIGGRARPERSGKHRRDPPPHPRDGRRHRADLRGRPLHGRHVGDHPAGSAAQRDGGARCSSKPGRARATPCAWASRGPRATCS